MCDFKFEICKNMHIEISSEYLLECE